MTVIVAGQGRKSGKTTAVCDIIAATRGAFWTAIKLTPHSHGADLENPVVFEERESGATTDTARYLAAGAQRAFWVRSRAADFARAIKPLAPGNSIIESNSAAGHIPADLVIFVDNARTETKASADRASALADLHIQRVDDSVLERIRGILWP